MRRKAFIEVMFFCTVILFLSGTVSIACAGDWPMIYHDSHHTGYTDERISGDLELLWSYEVDNVVSAPIVAEGKVFFGSQNGKIYCLDENNGEHIWSYNTGEKFFSSPAVSDGKVFVSVTNNLYCLNVDTGEVIWSTEISGSSPTVANGKVFMYDGKTYCLDEDTGEVIWSYESGISGDDYNSPVVAEGKVFASSPGKTFCLNESTGKLIWSYMFTDIKEYTLTVANGKVFAGGVMDVYCLNEATGVLIWAEENLGWAMLKAAPAVANGKVFVNGDKTYCLDVNTGDIIWSSKILGDSPIAIATDKVFGVSPSYIYCLKENTGEVIWKHECQGGTAVIANGKVFLGSSICNETGYFNNGIYCFGSKRVFSRGKEAPSEEKNEKTREEERMKEKEIPGFEAVFTIAGLLAAVYILRRR